MAWKFRRYKIKWNKKTRKFKKKKINRQKSREAHIRWRKNKNKMKSAMRKSKVRRKITMKKNKAMGIYKKLKLARKRFKNILKSDINLDLPFDALLNEELAGPEIELGSTDIPFIQLVLRSMEDNVKLDGKEERKEFKQFIKDGITRLSDFKDVQELEKEDADFLGDILSFVEEYGEELGILVSDDKVEKNDK